MNQTPSMDKAFLSKLTDIILANLENENFGVKELSHESGMSHYRLNRKLHASANKTINQFIREIRLLKALELLQQTELTAAEVCFKVGFGSPAYFTKCFHEYHGYPPGEVKNRVSEDYEKTEGIITPESNVSRQELTVAETKQKNRKRLIRRILFFALLVIMVLFSLIYFFNDSLFKSFIAGKDTRLKDSDKSIAVLPFRNLSNDKENQYFADGVMEDILNHLFRIRELRVISRTSVEQFRESTKASPEIAKTLGVNYVLEGSVLRYEKKVRVFVQLIDAMQGKKEEALEWLEKGVEAHSARIPRIINDPTFENLRTETRFVALIKKMGLSDYYSNPTVSKNFPK